MPHARLSFPRVVKGSLFVGTATLAVALGCSSSNDPTTTGTGGAATGGAVSTGGASATGGATATGGDTATGGATATGGVTDTGGAPSTGGLSGSAGGTHGGGRGGAAATGGTRGGGGATGAGGGAAADCASLKLCDDFEGAKIDSSLWKTSMGSGYTLALATDQFHSGKQSVHIMAPTATGAAQLTSTKGFPATDFWGRAWLRFKTSAGGHQMYIAHNASGDQLRVLNRLGSSDAIQVNFQKSDQFFASKTAIPMETWFCYEWHVSSAGVQVFKDGAQLTDVKVTATVANPSNFIIGYQRFQNGTSAGEMWIDDVAINTAQIGCN